MNSKKNKENKGKNSYEVEQTSDKIHLFIYFIDKVHVMSRYY